MIPFTKTTKTRPQYVVRQVLMYVAESIQEETKVKENSGERNESGLQFMITPNHTYNI